MYHFLKRGRSSLTIKIQGMKKVKPQLYQPEQRIKVQLDDRTIIFINRIASLAEWIKKYPNAKVISTENYVTG